MKTRDEVKPSIIPELTTKEMWILGHTLGINVYHAQRSKVKKDKKLPDEFYRNYFCAGTPSSSDYPILKELENKGIMESWTGFSNIYFGVTKEGFDLFRIHFNRLMKEPII